MLYLGIVKTRVHGRRFATVLVAEDDPVTRELIVAAMEESGFRTVCAAEGIDAFNAILETHPNVIILDLDLPRLPGCQICSMVRRSTAVQHTPIVVISGHAGKQDKLSAFELGADDYVTKPFHMDELVARVDAVLHRSRQQNYPTPFLSPDYA